MRSALVQLFQLLAVLVMSTLIGCSPSEQSVSGPAYSKEPRTVTAAVYPFAVHPLLNPAKLNEAYNPLIQHLNRQLPGSRFELEASRDYAAFEEKVASRKPALLLPNPWQTLQAMEAGYTVIAISGDPQEFKGIFLVRKDSGIRHPADLKGKTVCYPSHTALAACIMPQYYLYQQGVNVRKDIKNSYVGTHDSVIMNVFQGNTAAGGTWPPPWRAFQKEHPAEAAQLELIWETPSLINNSVMVRRDLPQKLQERIKALLVQLDGSPEGQKVLAGMGIDRFRAATDRDYEVVRRYVNSFEKNVRPVKEP